MEGQKKLDTRLRWCVKHQDVAGVIQTIGEGANVHYIDARGNGLMFYAMWSQNEKITTLLLSAGVSINDTSGRCVIFSYMLHQSGSCFNTSYFKFLIANKAHIDISVFFCAIDYGNLPGAYILYEAGVLDGPLVNIQACEHTKHLENCIRYNRVASAEFLVELGMRVGPRFFERYGIPDWWRQQEKKRQNVSGANYWLKHILRRRFKLKNKPEAAFLGGRIPKDIIGLIEQHILSTRFNKAWE